MLRGTQYLACGRNLSSINIWHPHKVCCFDSMFPWYAKSKVNSNGVCNYYDFIRREGLSLAIWFHIVESVFGENIHMTVKILQMFIN